MSGRSPQEITEALRLSAHRACVQGDAQYQISRLERFMGNVGAAQCAGDVVDRAIKKLGGDPYSAQNQ